VPPGHAIQPAPAIPLADDGLPVFPALPPTALPPSPSPMSREERTHRAVEPDNGPAVEAGPIGVPPSGVAREAVHASRRRRRSASPLPPLPSPADVPEDAAGRVAFLAIAVADDVVPPAPALAEAPLPAVPQRAAPLNPLDEWLPVILLGAVMLVVFIIGMVVTH